MKLEGHVALVTGGNRGIGRSIALAFAREGAEIIITARSLPELEATRDEIATLGAPVTAIAVDLAERDAADQLFSAIDPNRITLLVNNAGIGSSADPRPMIDFDDAFWERSLWVNLTIPYQLSKRVLPGMVERHAGRIINIASVVGKTGMVHGVAYVASKHGILGLTRALAIEVVREGITVNAICPGPVATLVNDKRVAYDAARLGRSFEEHEQQITPMGGRLEPDEIAPLAVYLASEDARAVTGQAFNIDGGSLMV